MKDFHVHSCFSDGKNTPEEIVKKAIEMGLTDIGISDHSFTSFDKSCCLQKEMLAEYRNTILNLKEKYKDKINVHLGIEQDYYSDESTDEYEYIIGSVHYLKCQDEYIPLDLSPEILEDATKKYYGGDPYSLIEDYYEKVSEIFEKTGCDIIGHFDLITKFTEKHSIFSEDDERYRKAYKKAADKLIKTGAVFEINTGAISRGYRTMPYPSKEIYEYLKSHGAKFILSSDSHAIDTICYKFDSIVNL